MPDVVLKNREGLTTTYSNVEQVVLKDTNGNYVYYSLGGTGGISVVTVLTLEHYTDSHAEKLAEIVDAAEGDMAIIKAPIETSNPSHWEYTAYVYQEPVGGEAFWQPMDGNYSLDNVYLKDDIRVTTTVGYLTPGTVASKGKSMSWLVDKMLTHVSQPNATNPSITYTINGVESGEVGTTISPTWEVTFNPGSFTYGPATGCTSTSIDVVPNSGGTAHFNDGWTSVTGNYGTTRLSDISYVICTLMCENFGWTASTGIAVDSIGNPADPPVTIAAASGQRTDQIMKSTAGYRKMFWGYISDDNITSAVVRALSGNQKNGALSAFIAEDTTKYGIIIAAPKGTRTLTKVVMPSSQQAEVTGEFQKLPNTVMVEGANGYSPKAYDVWLYHPAIMAGTYQITMS